MKVSKICLSILLLVSLTACGGHGYEGKYAVKTSNELLNAFDSALGGENIIEIGSDYIISDGEKNELDKIYVSKEDGNKYLVFKDEDGEEKWMIEGKKTLSIMNGYMKVFVTRID